MVFINATDTIGVIMNSGTSSMTGSLFASLFFVFIILFVMCFMFQIPLEFGVIILLPFCIGVAAYNSSFLILIITILSFVAMIIAKNWLFR